MQSAQEFMQHLNEGLSKLWKDAKHGRVLLCDAELGEQLAGILATPLGRVAKQNPDRTISTEGRFVHDQRESNELRSMYDHPPALQPRRRGLARLILWWKVNYPGRRIFLAKRDGGTRPIGFTSVFFRIWSRSRHEVAPGWERANDENFFWGSKGRSCC